MSGGLVVCPPTPPKYLHDNFTLWAGCGGVSVWFHGERVYDWFPTGIVTTAGLWREFAAKVTLPPDTKLSDWQIIYFEYPYEMVYELDENGWRFVSRTDCDLCEDLPEDHIPNDESIF